MFCIATVNVNGLRAAHRRGMPEWLAQRQPDVLLLQEVRAPDAVVHDLLGPDWTIAHQASDVKGRAGVAIASRLPIEAVRVGLGDEVLDAPEDTGRWLEADVRLASGEMLTVISAYLHSGTVGEPSMDLKYAYLDRVSERLAALADCRLVMLAGDINIAHTERDIRNHKGNKNSAGFLPEERAYLTRWFDAGWVDLGRRMAGEVEGPYTWWSWRGKAFDNDAGWRIDYQIVSPDLAEAAREVAVDRAATYDARFSDHAPLVGVYDL